MKKTGQKKEKKQGGEKRNAKVEEVVSILPSAHETRWRASAKMYLFVTFLSQKLSCNKNKFYSHFLNLNI